MSVIRAPRGADFKVSSEQWSELRQLILRASQREPAAQDLPRHLLFKWDPDVEPRTVALHAAIARSRGSVRWGKFGKPGGRRTLSSTAPESFGVRPSSNSPTRQVTSMKRSFPLLHDESVRAFRQDQ